MAKREGLARSTSASSASTMSCIQVAASQSTSSVVDHASPSPTPPTSVTDDSAGDSASIKQEIIATSREASAQAEPSGTRRSVRSKLSTESYNLAKLSDIQHGKRSGKTDGARSFSGDTLVNEVEAESSEARELRRQILEGEVEKALDMDWQVGNLADARPVSESSSTIKRRKSTPMDKISKAAGKITGALGKRNRDAADPVKDDSSTHNKRQSKRLSVLEQEQVEETIAKLEESVRLEDEDPTPAAKKPRLLDTIVELTSSLNRTVSTKKKPTKKWLSSGLYAGQSGDFKGTLTDAKKKAKASAEPSSSSDPSQPRQHMPYPMFSAGTRQADFQLTFDIFAPASKKENPKDWKKLNKNSFHSSAKAGWRTRKLEPSMCGCPEPDMDSIGESCTENCLNRIMGYECDDTNCSLSLHPKSKWKPERYCSNRAFAELAKRTCNRNESGRSSWGTQYDYGVDIIHTRECGYGLRANRCFEPGQIIIEYCGEVISQEESDRRMNEIYKDRGLYYLMEFDQGMIIDATKGNIARFVNHSCAPNCTMEKRIVRGEPKMALFAGPNGVFTGEELSYDYNFDNFSNLNVLDCRCGAEFCRGKLMRRDAKKEKENLAASLKRKLEEAMTAKASPTPEPSRPEPLKKRKTGRWSKGWSYVDPEMEAIRLKEDAIEKGKDIDARALEVLKAEAERVEKKGEPVVAGRGSRTASVRAKEKMLERAGSVRSAIGRRTSDAGIKKEKAEKRKSMLSRAGSLLRNATSANEETVLESKDEIVVREESKDEDKPLLADAQSIRASVESKRSGKMKQTTLGFTAINNRPATVARVEDLGDEVDVLEMVLNAGKAAGRTSI